MFAKPCCVIVVDDHPSMRLGLQAIISSHSSLKCVGTAADGNEAVDLARQLQPDVVVMDMQMPHCDGLEATMQLTSDVPNAKVVAYTMRSSPSCVTAAIRAGARAYVSKESPSEVLIDAIVSVRQGKRFMDPRLSASVFEELRNDSPIELATALSTREKQVLRSFAEGYTISTIANKHRLSEKTVESYKVRACDKLGLKSRSEIVRFACMAGWFEELITA